MRHRFFLEGDEWAVFPCAWVFGPSRHVEEFVGEGNGLSWKLSQKKPKDLRSEVSKRVLGQYIM